MMDDNYEDQEQMQNGSEDIETDFKYQDKEEVHINKLVHSIVYESSKNKSVMSETMVKKLCQNVGMECNQDSFFNLMGSVADFVISQAVTEIKQADYGKTKKDKQLRTATVRRMMEEQGIFMYPNRVVPEFAIPEGDQVDYNFEESN